MRFKQAKLDLELGVLDLIQALASPYLCLVRFESNPIQMFILEKILE